MVATPMNASKIASSRARSPVGTMSPKPTVKNPTPAKYNASR
jgi:hypothetical protein